MEYPGRFELINLRLGTAEIWYPDERHERPYRVRLTITPPTPISKTALEEGVEELLGFAHEIHEIPHKIVKYNVTTADFAAFRPTWLKLCIGLAKQGWKSFTPPPLAAMLERKVGEWSLAVPVRVHPSLLFPTFSTAAKKHTLCVIPPEDLNDLHAIVEELLRAGKRAGLLLGTNVVEI
ncbi:MAG: hypothetical protein NZ992_00110 [Candidatus Korarchaeum sp.]|nr:hypothetical protein [Candidatus Korarchaeum sp.]